MTSPLTPPYVILESPTTNKDPNHTDTVVYRTLSGTVAIDAQGNGKNYHVKAGGIHKPEMWRTISDIRVQFGNGLKVAAHTVADTDVLKFTWSANNVETTPNDKNVVPIVVTWTETDRTDLHTDDPNDNPPDVVTYLSETYYVFVKCAAPYR